MMHPVSSQESSRLEELIQRKSTMGAIVSMALPTVVSQLIGVVYHYADAVFVGWRNQPEEVAAVSLTLPVMLLLTAIANFWGVGGGSMLSRSLGRHDFTTGRQAAAFSLYGALLSSGLPSIVIGFGGDGVLRLLGATDTVLPGARAYFFWFATVGGIPAVMSMVLAHLIRAEGHARVSGNGLILGGLCNVILDPLFIFPFGFGMGVEGAALATMLSNCLSVLFFLVFLCRNQKRTLLTFDWRDAKIPWKMSREILAVGLPSALIMFCSAISNNVLNYLVAGHGDQAIAAVGIAKKMDMLPSHISVGITQGALPLLAYAYAAGRRDKLKDILYTTLKLAFTLLVSVVLLMQFFAPQLAILFIREHQTVFYATKFIRILSLSVPLYALSTTVNAFYQAVNRPRTAFFLSLIRKGLVDVPLMFAVHALFPFTMLLCVQPSLDLVNAIVSLLVLRHDRKELNG